MPMTAHLAREWSEFVAAVPGRSRWHIGRFNRQALGSPRGRGSEGPSAIGLLARRASGTGCSQPGFGFGRAPGWCVLSTRLVWSDSFERAVFGRRGVVGVGFRARLRGPSETVAWCGRVGVVAGSDSSPRIGLGARFALLVALGLGRGAAAWLVWVSGCAWALGKWRRVEVFAGGLRVRGGLACRGGAPFRRTSAVVGGRLSWQRLARWCGLPG